MVQLARRGCRVAHRCPRRPWLGIALAACLLSSARAQELRSDAPPQVHQTASRAELEALAVAAEQLAASSSGNAEHREQKRAEAEALRLRLRDGDFRVGDRVVLSVRGDSALTDTFTVRPGPALSLPGMPLLSLQGVLRSELQEHLTVHVAKLLRDPEVEAYPLIRLGVLGEVDRPGYYFVMPDALVTDAIMVAGGPTREADLTKTTMRRGSTPLWGRNELRAAVMQGTTLDQLGLHSGDEIVIGERRSRWETVLRTAGYVSGIVLGIYGATRIGK